MVRKKATRIRKRVTKVNSTKVPGVPKYSKNPKDLVLIYKHITRIEGTKGTDSLFPNQRFYHNFKKPYPAMYGTRDKKTLIIK